MSGCASRARMRPSRVNRESAYEMLGLRTFLTTVVMVCVWWSLVVGHVLNNVKGMM